MLEGRNRSTIIIMLMVLAWLLSACSNIFVPGPTATPEPSSSPATAAAPAEAIPADAQTTPLPLDPPGTPSIPPVIRSGAQSTSLASSAVAISPDGSIVAAVNPDSDSITLVDSQTLAIVQEVPVGDDPRSVAFAPNSRLALVSNYGSASISLVDVDNLGDVTHISVGPMPYGVVTDGQQAFVSEFAKGRISVIDLDQKALVQNLPVSPFPAGLALRLAPKDAEGQNPILLVTHFFTGQVTAIDLKTLSVIAETSTGADTNLSQAIITTPDGLKAYLPQTRSNTTNTALTFDTTVFPVVNVLDLADFNLLTRQRITLDTADQPVNMPFAAAVSPGGERLYVVNAGSDDLSVIDLNTNQGLAHLEVGANPRGIAISPDGLRLFVNNTLDGTLSVVDANTLEVVNTIAITRIPLPPEVLLGKQIFNSAAAPTLTTDRWISCATCHFDGGMDARTWLGFPDGPRNTPVIFGVGETLPMHWSGDLDELQDVELTIRDIQFGEGLAPGEAHDSLGEPHSGASDELDALASYMTSLKTPPSPLVGDPEAVQRGAAQFNTLGLPDLPHSAALHRCSVA
jgi:YVTN family beta-propeller protein